ncbi:hypothetical protein ACLB2K_065673 [Fragaria x ananassa]
MASALMESIQQSVGLASSSSHPSPMSAVTVSPGAPPLMVRPFIVDNSSTRSPSASANAPESARRIVSNARIKVRSPTTPAPKKKRGLYSEKKAEDIVQQTGQKIKLEYCHRVRGPSRLSLANKRNRGEKTMHHHTWSSPIIYTMEELKIQGEQLLIIKSFEKIYVRAGDEDMTKKYKGNEIRGMRRGGERDLSYSSNGSTSHSRPFRVDEQQLQEVQERYEQRLKESEERAQQQLQEIKKPPACPACQVYV